jgi:hypothetical protein
MESLIANMKYRSTKTWIAGGVIEIEVVRRGRDYWLVRIRDIRKSAADPWPKNHICKTAAEVAAHIPGGSRPLSEYQSTWKGGRS